MVKAIMRWFLKDEINEAITRSIRLGERTGREKALQEMVELGQGYVCKYCGTSVARKALSDDKGE